MSESLKALEHDVAKYILRTAQNLPAGPVPDALRPLLLRDFYGRAGEPSPRMRFAENAAALDEEARAECLRAFEVLADREEAMRAGEPSATKDAIAAARAIADAILGSSSEEQDA